jgi:acetamidase/formamidase
MPQHHHLGSEPEHLSWGYFDAKVPPVLTIDSGDTVTIDAIPAADWHEIPADRSRLLPDHLLALEKVVRGPGPHPVTGPIAVRGAKAGTTLQIDILEISVRQDWGYTEVLPLMGTLPEEFPEREHLVIDIDLTAQVAKLPWGAHLKLAPFFGIIAVAPPPSLGRQTSIVPRAYGGNMDNKALGVGTTLYLPVFNDGGLLLVGDGHGIQGDGEVCVTALETAVRGTVRVTVREDLRLTHPFAETATHLISIGINEDLDDAVRQAVSEMVRAVCARSNLSRTEAYMLCSLAGDLKVTQVVDRNKGAHMMLPKSTFAVPREDLQLH